MTSRLGQFSVMVGAILGITAMIGTSTQAAFSGPTLNESDNQAAGDVQIVDDDQGCNVRRYRHDPGDPVVKCIVVTYQGNLVPVDVSLYGTSGGSLDAYLDMSIEEGNGGFFRDCTGFTTSSTVFNNTLADFTATHNNFGNGITGWSPVVNPESKTYRITLTMQDNNTAQGLNTTGTFTWETQSH